MRAKSATFSPCRAKSTSSGARVQVKLTPEEKKLLGSTRPVNPKAHDDYLKGHYLCDSDTREGLDKGIQLLQQATQEDPNDPLAFAGLADCYALWAWAGEFLRAISRPKT